MYKLNMVSKYYNEVCALRDVTCRIPVDSLVVIMGPSGAGKSTLLRLLSFIELPDCGTVELDLDSGCFSSEKEQRPWPVVTCVFQKQFLWPHLTLRENILLPLKFRVKYDYNNRINQVIELFDMKEFIDRYPNEVSGGQAQRAALGRALVLDPKIILIDEAHMSLDLEQQSVLNDYLIKLRSNGVGLIIVSHSFEFAYRFADNIIVIEEGRIVEEVINSNRITPISRYLKNAVILTNLSRNPNPAQS